MDTRTIFSDLIVLELANVLAGPATGQFFAELGAEVIKIENPTTGGDVTRSWRLAEEDKSKTSAYFSAVNWGKKSIALDIHTAKGREFLHRLVSGADIVITSFKPGDAVKLGADYATLQSVNPGIIYGSITGYGKEDPRAGYDAVIQAESGFMSMNGEKDADPLKMPVALMDILAAHQLKEAILLALLHRWKTGEGSEVSVSLMDAAISSLANQGSNYLKAGKVASPKGSLHPNIAPYGESFICRDGERLLLAIGNDRQFSRFCHLVGLPDLLSDSRFADNTCRVKNRGELSALLQRACGKHDAKTLADHCRKQHIPVGQIHRIDQALAQSTLPLFQDKNGHGIPTFIGTSSFNQLSAPPEFGADTDAVLARFSGANPQGRDDHGGGNLQE